MKIKVDEHGSLRRPVLHDGYIDAIELEPGKGLHIALRDVTGARFALRLTGLRRLLCNNFREGNIVLSVSIACGVQPDDDLIRRLLGGTAQAESMVAQTARDICDGRLTLVAIDPSYGCELAALCESAEIEGL